MMVQAETAWQEPLFASEAPRTSTIIVADLNCLACGDSFELTVGCLAALPPLPARCASRRGSVLVAATASRDVRTAVLIDWREGAPNGSLLVQEMKTKRAAGSNGVEEGLDFSWWGRG
jgi:hypothetical protein